MKVRLTLSGSMMTDDDDCSPLESVTVSVTRYRVLPLKSWPVVGIVNVPVVEPADYASREELMVAVREAMEQALAE